MHVRQIVIKVQIYNDLKIHILHSTRSSLGQRSTPIFELIFLPVPLQAGKLSGNLEPKQADCVFQSTWSTFVCFYVSMDAFLEECNWVYHQKGFSLMSMGSIDGNLPSMLIP